MGRDKHPIRPPVTTSLAGGSALDLLRPRIASAGAAARLARVAASTEPLPFCLLVPGLEGMISWDGGYVRPFLERARAGLGERCRFVPMYSMSTEVVETVSTVVSDEQGKTLAFLPLAPGVLYEFLPEAAEDLPDMLLRPDQLRVGEHYTLVVSDRFGLLR